MYFIIIVGIGIIYLNVQQKYNFSPIGSLDCKSNYLI